MEYTDTAMKNAVAITRKIESFLIDSDAYIHGYTALGDVNESYLLKVKYASQLSMKNNNMKEVR
jgi:hypothetical protein